MELYRDDDVGFWKLDATEEELELKPDYIEALPRYLCGLESIFAKARACNEAQLRPINSTLRGGPSIRWASFGDRLEQ